MRTSRAFLSLLVLALTLVILLSFIACKKKEPVTVIQPTAPPTEGPKTWQPEPPKTEEPTGAADYWNKQGVMKRIHFETNKYAILPGDRAILKQNAAWLLAHPQFRVAIEGHCDERNTEAYNLALGERRANAAKEYLVGLGVPVNKIQTVSYGKSRPICFDHDESCWGQNRRDEFLLQDVK
jgi:peptidoglycan-associated lipoprotein